MNTDARSAGFPELMREPGTHKRMSREARRISSQHRKLDTLYGLVVDALGHGRLPEGRSAFQRFHDALEAHFSLEDELYFPALHGLRSDLGDELARLSGEHEALRRALDEVENAFRGAHLGDCERLLDHVATAIADHEEQEEQLLRHFQPG
ncbi:MAG: hemerythrin domain-containing protein [Deltaproteobacteria bacterium]|nr:hemerythrin domain-containing protein [Deltaproteobacteria bacterium]MBW2395258.1 hemerythrin domain-containing protein [Deltaproteobacteria bacterium]